MDNSQIIVNPLADHVSVVQRDKVKIIRITHPKADAEISLHGGHVLSYTPAGQKDLLWLSETTAYEPSKAIRGGIPICWPWFGRIAAPAHGFARTAAWELVEHRESEEGVIVCLGLRDNAETQAIWPNAFHARLYVEVSDSLKVTLDITNTDDKAWKFSGALHSYFNIADITQSITTGMGTKYNDSLQDGKECTGDKELMVTGSTDRVYTQPETVMTISDPQNSRTISITNNGDNAAIIWNPWVEGAKNMGDMPDEGYKNMLCVESVLHANSLEEGKNLEPGSSYQLVTEIALV